MGVLALVISVLSFYRSYIYTKQDLQVTVTEVSYMTNHGGVYMTIAFANGGNRDAAVLRAEPALWSKDAKDQSAWRPLGERVHPDIPITSPKTPLIVKATGIGSTPSDIVISKDDASKIQGENEFFLSEGRVVIATDGP